MESHALSSVPTQAPAAGRAAAAPPAGGPSSPSAALCRAAGGATALTPSARQPLVRRDLDVGPDPEPAGIAPRRHRRQRVVRPRALVRIDHARQFADEQRPVVAQLLRELPRVRGYGPADARPRSRPNRRSSPPRPSRHRRSRHSRARPARRSPPSTRSPSCRSTSASTASAEAPVGGDQPDPRPHVMLGLREQVGRDHLRVAGLVGQDVDLRRPGQLVDPDRPEHLPLRLVDEGIPRPDDLVDLRHASRCRRPSPRSPAPRRSGRSGRPPTDGTRRPSPDARSAAGRRSPRPRRPPWPARWS